MKIAFITRTTLYSVPGGDTIQVLQTARQLTLLGVQVDIQLSGDRIDYSQYDLFHFFNITRPADILYHIKRIKKPFALSPILIDYSEYDRYHRKGFSGTLLKLFPSSTNEYIKSIARWITGKDKLRSKAFLWKGQRKSILDILKKAAILLPNSETEYRTLKEIYNIEKEKVVIPNGIDPCFFRPDESIGKEEKLVLCAARVEGIKNQLNLIRAMNDTAYTLIVVGSAAPNQKEYYRMCRNIASGNIQFYEHMPQDKLLGLYKSAKVHVLPSWFESCGLSSLEAAAMGCNVVISDRGFTRDYFRDEAFYCNPGDPASIYNAIEEASCKQVNTSLQQRILREYTWQRAAALTFDSYNKIILN
jgi:glycosyltransferase involved in cell wall biosynthesis